jgi:hypothetical protein
MNPKLKPCFKKSAALLTASLLLCVTLMAAAIGAVQYTRDTKMVLPDYRQWVFLSSGLSMSYDPGTSSTASPRFENVFVNPDAYNAFLKNGTWPDQTALILEIRDSGTKVSINKDGRVQTDLIGISAHVKDASRDGWAFYAFDKNARQGNLLPASADCYSCHKQSGAVDTTFVQFYPTLIEIAKTKGTFKTAGDQ